MSTAAVAVLASGSGSTAEALIRDLQTQDYPYEVRLVITNNPDAFVLQRIANLNEEFGLDIRTAVISSSTQPSAAAAVHGEQTSEEQEALLALLKENHIDLVVLLGYMKHIGKRLTDAYGWQTNFTSVYQARMLNTHPGLLPETKGLYGIHVQEAVVERHLPEAGQTLHVVAEAYDEGPVVTEHRIKVSPDETPEELFARVQLTEKAHIAADIAEFLDAQTKFEEEK
ncbi:hypothetical protein KDA14_04020 [Candidatus Saccharibacteria bacterium]|nr:hypothetical protein [Candidatus Saccharibacteria bacterium]